MLLPYMPSPSVTLFIGSQGRTGFVRRILWARFPLYACVCVRACPAYARTLGDSGDARQGCRTKGRFVKRLGATLLRRGGKGSLLADRAFLCGWLPLAAFFFSVSCCLSLAMLFTCACVRTCIGGASVHVPSNPLPFTAIHASSFVLGLPLLPRAFASVLTSPSSASRLFFPPTSAAWRM